MLLLNKNVINKKVFVIITILCLLLNNIYCEKKYNLELESECTGNLECQSGCCKSGKCTETKECKSLANTVYIVQIVICIFLIAIFIIILIIKLRIINKDFKIKLAEKEEKALKFN